MKPVTTLAAAFLVAAASMTATSMPASAGGWDHRNQHHRHHGHHSKHRHGGIYFQYEPRFAQPVFGWQAHVRWCRDRYNSYAQGTNFYVDSWGKRRRCNSPFD